MSNLDVAALLKPDQFVAMNGLSTKPFTYRLTADQLSSAFEQLETAICPECIFIAPTISPPDTSDQSHDEGFLEHPRDVLAYYRSKGLRYIMAQEKLMGSRATVLAIRHQPEKSQIWSRTGRPFFDKAVKNELMVKVLQDLEPLMPPNWEWALLDTEAMPWSLKSGKLGNEVFRRSASAAAAHFNEMLDLAPEGVELSFDREAIGQRLANADQMLGLLDRYLPMEKMDHRQAKLHLFDIPLIVMSTDDGSVAEVQQPAFIAQYILNQMGSHQQKVLVPVKTYQIDLENPEVEAWITQKWLDYTQHGGEGFVFKTRQYETTSDGDFIIPAMKCRGREYMRLTYGVNYTEPENFKLFRGRKTARKRMLSAVEYQLTLSALIMFSRTSAAKFDNDAQRDHAAAVVEEHMYKTKLHVLACEQDKKIDIRL